MIICRFYKSQITILKLETKLWYHRCCRSAKRPD